LAKASGSRFSSGELSTLIGQDATLEGRLTVRNSVRIDGNMRGELNSTETVTIGPHGGVEGDITAADVVIGGKVTGSIICQGKVILEETAILTGDLRTVRLVVEEGATFNGLSEMGEAKHQPHPPKVINLEPDGR
jgi:cytoskeletal protein CcmA (bactofilin family)